ncbi:MAG TPA: deoxyribose-phosphate aldolase [Bdellovibrionales bacterium]|nr:deoxyribose-phosphate aldolase [Bdellovibrionales bacterium]
MQSTTALLKPSDLAAYIDHTLLKPEATEADVRKLCEEARLHSFKAVCVNPIYVAKTREWLAGSDVLTAAVVGFPLGSHLSKVKALEAELCVADGAHEIDMVMRIDLAREKRWRELEADIAAVVRAAGKSGVKVIFETGLLDSAAIIEACKASEQAGAAFVKTSTGFLGRGATVEDVLLMRKSCSMKVQIKASGGVKTFEQAQAMIEAGATRIGTSSGVALVTGTQAGSGY